MKITKDTKAIVFLIFSTILLFGYIVTQEKQQKFEYPPINTDVDDVIMLPSYVPEGYPNASANSLPFTFRIPLSTYAEIFLPPGA